MRGVGAPRATPPSMLALGKSPLCRACGPRMHGARGRPPPTRAPPRVRTRMCLCVQRLCVFLPSLPRAGWPLQGPHVGLFETRSRPTAACFEIRAVLTNLAVSRWRAPAAPAAQWWVRRRCMRRHLSWRQRRRGTARRAACRTLRGRRPRHPPLMLRWYSAAAVTVRCRFLASRSSHTQAAQGLAGAGEAAAAAGAPAPLPYSDVPQVRLVCLTCVTSIFCICICICRVGQTCRGSDCCLLDNVHPVVRRCSPGARRRSASSLVRVATVRASRRPRRRGAMSHR